VLQQKKMYEERITTLEQHNFSAAITTENPKKNANTQNEFGKVDIDHIEVNLSRSYRVPDDVSDEAINAELYELFSKDPDATYLDGMLPLETNNNSLLEELGLQTPEPVRALQGASKS